MLKKLLTYFLLIFCPSALLAEFCSDFEIYLKDRTNTNEVLKNKNSWKSFGYTIMSDVNKEILHSSMTEDSYEVPFLRDIDNYLIVKSVVHGGPFHRSDIRKILIQIITI